jgi:hypothetical protein
VSAWCAGAGALARGCSAVGACACARAHTSPCCRPAHPSGRVRALPTWCGVCSLWIRLPPNINLRTGRTHPCIVGEDQRLHSYERLNARALPRQRRSGARGRAALAHGAQRPPCARARLYVCVRACLSACVSTRVPRSTAPHRGWVDALLAEVRVHDLAEFGLEPHLSQCGRSARGRGGEAFGPCMAGGVLKLQGAALHGGARSLLPMQRASRLPHAAHLEVGVVVGVGVSQSDTTNNQPFFGQRRWSTTKNNQPTTHLEVKLATDLVAHVDVDPPDPLTLQLWALGGAQIRRRCCDRQVMAEAGGACSTGQAPRGTTSQHVLSALQIREGARGGDQARTGGGSARGGACGVLRGHRIRPLVCLHNATTSTAWCVTCHAHPPGAGLPLRPPHPPSLAPAHNATSSSMGVCTCRGEAALDVGMGTRVHTLPGYVTRHAHPPGAGPPPPLLRPPSSHAPAHNATSSSMGVCMCGSV